MTADAMIGAAACALWVFMLVLWALSIAITHKDQKRKASELHLVAYATYQLSLQIETLNKSNQKEDPNNEETESTEQH